LKSISKQRQKTLAKLKQKKYRDLENSLLVEGSRSVRQIIDDGVIIKQLFILKGKDSDYQDIIDHLGRDNVYLLEKYQIENLSTLPSPQDIIALVGKFEKPLKKRDRLLFLDRIANPANMGAIFRSAAAFGIQGVIISKECCDIYHPAAVRASVGKILSMPTTAEDRFDWTSFAGDLIVADLKGKVSVNFLKTEKPYIIALGSEAHGISDLISSRASITVFIPMANCLESLNVVVAGSVIMYQLNQLQKLQK